MSTIKNGQIHIQTKCCLTDLYLSQASEAIISIYLKELCLCDATDITPGAHIWVPAHSQGTPNPRYNRKMS